MHAEKKVKGTDHEKNMSFFFLLFFPLRALCVTRTGCSLKHSIENIGLELRKPGKHHLKEK